MTAVEFNNLLCDPLLIKQYPHLDIETMEKDQQNSLKNPKDNKKGSSPRNRRGAVADSKQAKKKGAIGGLTLKMLNKTKRGTNSR